MPLYGGNRDARLVKSFNEELINKIIDTQVGYYKILMDEVRVNVYGESLSKAWYQPVKVHCLIDRTDRDFNENEGAGQDWQQPAVFAFLRDELQSYNLVPEVGDIIEWDNDYFELDSIGENQYFVGKNQDTWFKGTQHGYNISLIVGAHVTKKNIPSIENVRVGMTPPPIDRGEQ